MTAARRALLAAQILALSGPVLVCTWVVFVISPNASGFFHAMTLGFAAAAVQGLAGIVWSGMLIHNHVELRNAPNLKLQLMAVVMTGMFAAILFTFLLRMW